MLNAYKVVVDETRSPSPCTQSIPRRPADEPRCSWRWEERQLRNVFVRKLRSCRQFFHSKGLQVVGIVSLEMILGEKDGNLVSTANLRTSSAPSLHLQFSFWAPIVLHWLGTKELGSFKWLIYLCSEGSARTNVHLPNTPDSMVH